MELRPYKHSPEEGTPEADEQPWTISFALKRESAERPVNQMPPQRGPKLRQPKPAAGAEPKR